MKFVKSLCSLGLLCGLAAQTLAQPANDSCSSPTTVTIIGGMGTAAVNTTGANEDGPRASCGNRSGSSNSLVPTRDVWYDYQPTLAFGAAEVAASNCSGLSSGLSVTLFTVCGGSELSEVCERNLCAGNTLKFFIHSGDAYYIRVASYATTLSGTPQQGTATLTIKEIPPAPNDDCENATEVSGPGLYAWDDTVTSLDRLPPSCSQGAGQGEQQDLWFAYTANGTGVAAMDCVGANVVLSVYTECDGTLLACDPWDHIAQTGTNQNNRNWIALSVISGTKYTVRIARDTNSVTGFQGRGPGQFRIREYPAPTAGDSCAAPRALTAGTQTVSNAGNRDLDANESLNKEDQAALWLRYTPTGNGIAIFEMLGTTPSANLDVTVEGYESCGGTAVDHKLYFPMDVQSGVPVIIRVSTNLVSSGIFEYYRDFQFRVTEQVAIQGDICTDAKPVVVGANAFNNLNATQPLSSLPQGSCALSYNGPPRRDMWFIWTAPSNGNASISTCWNLAQAGSTLLTMYTGSCSSLTQIGCNDDHEAGRAPGEQPFYSQLCQDYQSGIYFTATAGTTYYFRVGSQDVNTSFVYGDGRLNLTFDAPACPADFNGDHVRDVADLFGYINAWLAKTANANFNHDNAVDVADLFGFINAWLAGC